jgi:hypothetical protein
MLSALVLAAALPIVLSATDIDYDKPVPAIANRRDWLGLYRHGSSWTLRRATVSFVPSPQGPEVTLVMSPPGAAFLVAGVPAISPGKAATAAADRVPLWRIDPAAHYKSRGVSYEIRLESKEDNGCDSVIRMVARGRSQVLFDMKKPRQWACDDPHFAIQWAGDLDRDGRLDLLVTFSEKYSYHPLVLLLSSAARRGDLVGEAARYDRYAQ